MRSERPPPNRLPVFGQARSGHIYRERTGAYALIRSPDGCLALVEGREGRLFLPGGGCDDGETDPAALRREVAEECGWGIETGPLLAEAVEYVRAGAEGDFRLHARYYPAWIVEESRGEAEHRVVWLAPAEAAARLHRACDRWAAGRLVESEQP